MNYRASFFLLFTVLYLPLEGMQLPQIKAEGERVCLKKVFECFLEKIDETNIKDNYSYKVYVKLLLENDCNIQRTLFAAIEKDYWYLLDDLIRCGADVNATKTVKVNDFPRSLTPLMIAANVGKMAGMISLMERGANINLQDEQGTTALMFAASRGDDTMVSYLASFKNALVNVQRKDRATALMYAALSGHANTIHILLKNGADTQIADCHGKTALMHAACGGHFDAMEQLLNGGALPTITTKSGFSFYISPQHEKKVYDLLHRALATSKNTKRA